MSTFTGKGIDVYRLTVCKHAVLMEADGIRVARGPLVTPRMRREFGLRPRAPHAEVAAAIQAKIDELLPQAHAEGGIQP
jgi:hypothetical protein